MSEYVIKFGSCNDTKVHRSLVTLDTLGNIYRKYLYIRAGSVLTNVFVWNESGEVCKLELGIRRHNSLDIIQTMYVDRYNSEHTDFRFRYYFDSSAEFGIKLIEGAARNIKVKCTILGHPIPKSIDFLMRDE